jgi:hypothetical protein
MPPDAVPLEVPMQFLAALIALVLSFVPAAAQTSCTNIVDGSDPSKIFQIARGHGSAEIGTDNRGDPKVDGRMHGVKYQIYFYGCKNGENCTTVQFRAGFTQNQKQTVEQMNAWNVSKRFGKAAIDKDGDATIEFNVNLRGGVCNANFDETVGWWSTILREFLTHINFKA